VIRFEDLHLLQVHRARRSTKRKLMRLETLFHKEHVASGRIDLDPNYLLSFFGLELKQFTPRQYPGAVRYVGFVP
jgi:hypothetical protein